MGPALVGILSALAVTATPVTPLRVLVVRSDDSPNYRVAHDAFVHALGEGARAVDVVSHPVSSPLDETRPVDIVLALGTAAARRVAISAVGRAAVFAVVGDPISAGLADASGVSRTPLGGVSALAPVEEQLRLIRAAAPNVRRVGVVVNIERTGPLLAAISHASRGGELEIVSIPVSKPEEVGSALSAQRDRFDAILALPDPSVWNNHSLKAAVIFSLAQRRPLFGFSRAFTRAGALASLSAEHYEAMGEQVARLAIAQLAGQPAHVEPAAALNLSVNVVVAQRLGLTLPRGLTDRAQDVYR